MVKELPVPRTKIAEGTMTMTCDDYEVLAERAHRDALSVSERDGLERHLEDCGGCREFSDLASAIGGALRRRSENAGPAPDAQRLRAGFVLLVRRRRFRACGGIAEKRCQVQNAGLRRNCSGQESRKPAK